MVIIDADTYFIMFSAQQVSVLVLGGLVGLGAGNLSLRLVFPPGRDSNSNTTAVNPYAGADRWRDTPPPAVLRRFVLAVALASSIALATGGPPAALEPLRRTLAAGALGAVLLVVLCGGLWGCTRGAQGATGRGGGAREAYVKVASDDREAHEVELRPFVGGAEGDESDDDDYDGRRGDDDYLDEEDGYLADEGETERTSSSRRGGERGGGGAGGGGGGVGRGRFDFSTVPPARQSPSPPRRAGAGAGAMGEVNKAAAPGATATAGAGAEKNARPKEAPPAQSLFSVGHTMEL